MLQPANTLHAEQKRIHKVRLSFYCTSQQATLRRNLVSDAHSAAQVW
jgi:hypothetical protein